MVKTMHIKVIGLQDVINNRCQIESVKTRGSSLGQEQQHQDQEHGQDHAH